MGAWAAQQGNGADALRAQLIPNVRPPKRDQERINKLDPDGR